MHLRRKVLTHNTMFNLLHNNVIHLFAKRESVCDVLCVRSWEERDEGVFVRCKMWKTHQWLFNGTAEQLCPTSFRQTILRRLVCYGDQTEFVPVWVRSAWKRWKTLVRWSVWLHRTLTSANFDNFEQYKFCNNMRIKLAFIHILSTPKVLGDCQVWKLCLLKNHLHRQNLQITSTWIRSLFTSVFRLILFILELLHFWVTTSFWDVSRFDPFNHETQRNNQILDDSAHCYIPDVAEFFFFGELFWVIRVGSCSKALRSTLVSHKITKMNKWIRKLWPTHDSVEAYVFCFSCFLSLLILGAEKCFDKKTK